MEKLLQETFADLRLTARQQSVFEEVYVERLCLLREQKRVEVHIVSEHIIPYREIALLEYALNQLFDKAGFTVQVTDRFRLSEQYTPENFWQEYQDSILMILKESNVLEFNMFYSGECHLEGETLYLCCDDDILFRARETEVIKKVQDLFSRKAGFSITLKISYREPQIQEEEEISYRDVIQHKNQVQSVEAIERTQPVRIHYVLKANELAENIGLRFEVRDEVGTPLATSSMFGLTLQPGINEFTAEYDLSVLTVGKYSNYFTVITSYGGGTYGVEDWVPGIQFQLVDTFATYYEGWNRRAWGPICLPEPAVTLGTEE